MTGECVPFSYTMPPIEEVLDVLRKDPDSRFSLGHFGIDKFFQKGEMLEDIPVEDIVDHVMHPGAVLWNASAFFLEKRE